MSEPSVISSDASLKIALVAGEASGDIIAADLIREIKRHLPDTYFYGIGGRFMQDEGFDTLFPMEKLSVMGLVEVLSSLIELLGIRKKLQNKLLSDHPDVFIGIDAPDFNIALECQLKKAGIATVHYVSPQIWAWRSGRIKKIHKAVDHVLALLPFEVEYYRQHNVPATFVGHPLADQIPMYPDQSKAKKSLGIDQSTGLIIGLLPGSRKAEISKLGELFLETARLLAKDFSNVTFLIPCANDTRKQQVLHLVEKFSDLDVRVYGRQAHSVMAASDAILIASGTAVLEAALHKKPLVVSYKMSPVSFAIIRRMIKVRYISLPNLLADRELVPEVLQNDATAPNLCQFMKKAIEDQKYREELRKSFIEIHQQLKQNASEQACETILSIIKQAKNR